MKSIQWRLVLTYTLLLIFALELFGVYALSSLENYLMEDVKASLHNQVDLLSNLAERYFSPHPDDEGLKQLIDEFSTVVGRDLYLMDRQGVVVAASPGQEQSVGRRIVQQEIVTALQGNAGDSVRYDPDLGQRLYCYAEPVYSSGNVAGLVYASSSLDLVDTTMRQMRRILFAGTALTLLLSAVLGLSLSTTITRPLKKITRQAESMKDGDFSQNIDIHSADEIGRLAETFNDLAQQLQRSWAEVIQEKDKVEGILTNLSDGLLVFDHSGEVMHINSTACSWFGVNKEEILAQGTVEDFPQLESEQSIIYLEEELGLVLRQKRLPFLQEGKKQGTIVVLSDVTEQQRLNNMRQEFVANVSHELRTPLTSMKTYLEALQDHPEEDERVRQRFLTVLSAETDRMVRMVEDLLILSKNEKGQGNFGLVSMTEVIDDVVKGVEVQISNKGLNLELEVPDQLPPIIGDRDQIHRLLVNIVNNAISYTVEGEISISAISLHNYVEVTVKDTGIGIPSRDLTRIFERFYRVDKARSRKAGGTGLGLSIAKQIAEAHGGSINISSQEGKGTEVSIPLPMASQEGYFDLAKGVEKDD